MTQLPAHGLERALERMEQDIDAAMRAAAALTARLKRAKRAATLGAIRDLEASMTEVDQLAGSARDAVAALKAGWRFDARHYLDSGEFAREILAEAAQRGVIAQED